MKVRKFKKQEDELMANMLAKRQADPMSREDVALTPRSSTNSPRSDQIKHTPVVPTQSDALSGTIGDETGALPRVFKVKKASRATIEIKMSGLPVQVIYRMSQQWATDHQWHCIHGTPETDLRAFINSKEGKAYMHDNSRGYTINFEIKEIMIQLTQEDIDARTGGQHMSVIEARIKRQEHLKTEAGQCEHGSMPMAHE